MGDLSTELTRTQQLFLTSHQTVIGITYMSKPVVSKQLLLNSDIPQIQLSVLDTGSTCDL